MLQPRCIWIEDDVGGTDLAALPLKPTITIETSVQGGASRRHFIWRGQGMEWDLWTGIQQRLIGTHGSDPAAASRTQTLRLAGSWHIKNPSVPHLVRIIEEGSIGRAYRVNEIMRAFPPVTLPAKRKRFDASVRAGGTEATWNIEVIRATFDRLNKLLA